MIQLFLLLFIFSPQLQAAQSNFCDSENTFIYKSIHCCISTELSKDNCKTAINKMNPQQLSKIQSTTESIHNNQYPDGRTPNCFWSALGFHEISLSSEPKAVYEGDFKRNLNDHFQPIKTDSFHFGDIVAFDALVTSYPDILNGEPLETEIPFHAAIYLFDDFIFQKENSTTSVFSITKLTTAFLQYSKGFQEESESEGKLILKAFKKK